MDNIISYAQLYEDVILAYMLKDVEYNDIFYIDVGACYPERISVTKLFYDKGAQGINIEPSLEHYKKFLTERPRDININYAIGSYDGVMNVNMDKEGKLYKEGNGTFSSRDNNWVEETECKRLTTVLDENILPTQNIHFLKIDVEGFERECLEGMDFKRYRPWIICIEISTTYEWKELLLKAGYVEYYKDLLNAYLVDKNILHAIQPFPDRTDDFYLYLKEYYNINFKYNMLEDEQKRRSNANQEFLNLTKDFVVFGTGFYYRNFMKYGSKLKMPLFAVDNNAEKWNTTVENMEIKPPNFLQEYAGNDMSVLICCSAPEEIEKQLMEMEIRNYYRWQLLRW